jgi:hypothetical protein
VGGGRQIRRIDDGQSFASRIELSEQRPQQMGVELAQLDQIQPVTKLMEHFSVGKLSLVGQVRKLSPSPVLRQILEQEVEAMHWRQQSQQQYAQQLRRRERAASACAALSRKQLIDPAIIQIGRELM